jgi:hypothetical protein
MLRGDLEQIANRVEAPRSSSKRPWSKGWNPLMENPRHADAPPPCPKLEKLFRAAHDLGGWEYQGFTM